ncbi:MAG: DUF1552 domain-containing protein [Polyangiaceae bacterium]|nr:DUF1552 domain-containing protein [Polyangiaceae bacterium]
MISRHILKRRELLMGLGSAGFLAAPIFRDSLLEAQQQTQPIRFVVLHVAGGIYFPSQGEGVGGWTFDKVLRSLQPLQSECIRYLGFNNLAGQNAGSMSNEQHGAAMRTVLTGDSTVWKDGLAQWSPTNSIDQQIADRISVGLKFPSLQFGVLPINAVIDQRRIAIRNQSALPPVEEPATMFARLFGDAVPVPTPVPTSTGTGTAPSIPPPVPTTSDSSRQKSMLDHLLAEVATLKSVAGTREQQKLEEHLESLRQLEMRIQSNPSAGTGGSQGGDPPVVIPPQVGTGCAAPSLVSGNDIPAITANQLDLLYQSLVCDMTRVASVQFLCSAQVGVSFPHVGVSDAHHTLEHNFNPDLDKVGTWFVDQIAAFAARLKATPEGNSNMLDNSLLVICSEFGNGGDHNHSFIPFVTVGRAGGKVRPGRDIVEEEAAHNLLLRGLMQPFGINSPSIGDADKNSGTVPSLA